MRAAVDEEGHQAVAEGGRRVVDDELGGQEVDVPVVLASVGVGAQRIADAADVTPLARSTLALVFLWYAEPTMRHEPMLLTKARNTSLVNLGS